MNRINEVVYSERERYSPKPEAYIIAFGIFVCITAFLTTDVLLFGYKTDAMFDVWTLVHIASGVILGYFAILARTQNIHHPIMLLLLISFGWEIIEHYLELSSLPVISDWFSGQESIENRLIADQIAIVFGFMLIKQRPNTLLPAVIFTTIFVVLHLIVGDSMYFLK